MSEERSDELTRHERAAFGSLAGEAGEVPPREMEDRIVAALSERGLVTRRASWLRWYHAVPPGPRLAIGAASVLIAFGLGMEYGKRSAAVPAQDAVPEVRLESSDENEKEPVHAPSGTMVATEVDLDEDWTVSSQLKPDLASLGNGGYGAFPPFPLEGRDVSISPKYR